MGTRTHAHIAEGEPSGLSEADIAASITTLEKLSNTCDADISRLRTHDEEAGQVAEFLVRRRCAPDKFSEVRVAVVGNVDAGKRCSRFLGIAAHRQTQTNTRAHTHLHTHTHTHTHTQVERTIRVTYSESSLSLPWIGSTFSRSAGKHRSAVSASR